MRVVTCLFCLVQLSVAAYGQIELSGIGKTYFQDFDSLASSGTSSFVPLGWVFAESGTNANTTYTAGTGSGTTGDTYSFGSSGSTERAFGTLRSSSLITIFGASFSNSTGVTIKSLLISCAGEQWRCGATGRLDRLDFQYSTDATGLTDGTWIDFDLLDFSSPDTATKGPLNGNDPANRDSVSSTISGLSIADGSTFWIRWKDFDAASYDDGLAVDNFSLTPLAEDTPLHVVMRETSAEEASGRVVLGNLPFNQNMHKDCLAVRRPFG